MEFVKHSMLLLYRIFMVMALLSIMDRLFIGWKKRPGRENSEASMNWEIYTMRERGHR